MLKVVAVGVPGVGSCGDDSMVHCAANGLTRRFGSVRIIPISRLAEIPFPGETTEEHNARSMASLNEFLNTMMQFTEMKLSPDMVVEYEPWDLLAEADLVLLGGGALFADGNTSFSFGPVSYFSMVTLAAKACGVPIFAYAQSLGPLRHKWSRRLAAWSLQQCAAVTVRDKPSQALAAELGVDAELLPDPSIALRPIAPVNPLPDNCLLVAPRDIGDEALFKRLAKALDLLIEWTGCTVLFVPHCTFNRYPQDNDRNVALAITSEMTHKPFISKDPPRPEPYLGVYEQAPFALTVRLHGAVFAATAGTPFLAMDYHPKVAGFCDWVGAPYLPIDADPDAIARAVLDGWQNRDETAGMLRRRMDELRPLTERYWDICEEILNGWQATD